MSLVAIWLLNLWINWRWAAEAIVGIIIVAAAVWVSCLFKRFTGKWYM
jgi:hypothetical protein